MRKKSRAAGCSAFMRWYCCMAGVGAAAVLLMSEGARLQGAASPRPGRPRRAREYILPAMRVLAVDTTTERESVAVAADGELLGEVRLRSDILHSRRLMPAVAHLLEGLG